MPTKQSDYGGPRREQHGPPKIVQNPPVATVVQAFGEREGANEEGEVSVLASTRRVWRKRRGWRVEDRGDTLMMIDLSSKEGAWSFSAALAAIAQLPTGRALERPLSSVFPCEGTSAWHSHEPWLHQRLVTAECQRDRAASVLLELRQH